MSEIFEALRKAQRDAGTREGDAPSLLDEQPALNELPSADAAPLPESAPAPPRRRRWLRNLLQRSFANGNGAAQVVSTLSLQHGTQIAEQFRMLRTRIQTAGPGMIMITSALGSEGKTLCAANLAQSLAMNLDSEVLLVDADLRHPSAAQVFHVSNQPGLVDCLVGDASWLACIRSTQHERLRLIPAGTISSISTELLASERMEMLVAELKAQFPKHYVVFDAPPLLLTADPLVLAQHMDRILLVVRADVTPRDAVLKAIEMLGSERFFGVVFNGATEQLSHYYQHRYYYGRYHSSNGTTSGA